VRDGPQARVAQFARSCARFLGRAPLVARERLSPESATAVAECERVVADALRRAAEALVEHVDAAPRAGDALASWSAGFATEAERLQQALDDDPALGVLRDVFADVVGDAAKLPEASAAPAAGRKRAAARSAPAAPAVRRPRAGRGAKAAGDTAATAAARPPSRRRRPEWQPPADPDAR
jgi:hypothetical protein